MRMSGSDIHVSIPALRFNAFSQAIRAFNRRTEQVNAGLGRPMFETVSRFPESHHGDMVSVVVAINDRARVLFQELSEIIDHFITEAEPAEAVSKPVQPVSARQWGIWVPCADEADARAAAGFLTAIAKVGIPQVECRG